MGIIYELVGFGVMLLCGYLLSELLKYAMTGLWRQVYETGALTALALLVTILPQYALAVCRSKARLADTQNFREFLYENVLNRSIRVSDRGEMNVRMNSDVRTIAAYFQQTVPKAVSGAAVMSCSTVLICLIDCRIALIFFLLNLTQLIPIIVYEKWARQIYNQTHSDEETYCNWMLEGYGGIRTIKSYGVEAWYMDRYYKLNQAIVQSGKRAEQVNTVENIIFQSIDSLLGYGSYVIIGLFVLFGGLGIEDTPLLTILAGYLFSSISSVFDWRLQQFDYQEAYKRLGYKEPAAEHVDGTGAVSVEGIAKSYGEKQVLRDVSCVIHTGDRVLLKGDNGSGKSTLLRIMMGLEEADSGKVTYGIAKNACALSLQEEPELNISGEELVQAMTESGRIDKNALTQHFRGFRIQNLLSKSLSELSPGERKKFYLSAALAHNGQLLMLDEPTNHLDQRSISYLVSRLRPYTGTLVVCTHALDMDLKWNRTILVEGGVCHES